MQTLFVKLHLVVRKLNFQNNKVFNTNKSDEHNTVISAYKETMKICSI